MPSIKTNHTRVAGVCCALPKKSITMNDFEKYGFDKETINSVTSSVGVKKLFVADENLTASDICFAAAEDLILNLKWERDSIDGLIFISQSPDYIMPATSGILQAKLGLSTDCFTLDINLGCSAFANGFFLAAQMIESGACKRILVLIGDTIRRFVNPKDKSLTFIISDGGSATGIEYVANGKKASIKVKSDGSRFNDLIIPVGGCRNKRTDDTSCEIMDKDGSVRSQENMYMDGKGVFTFAVKEVPIIINEILELQGWDKSDVDLFLVHQANAYMLKFIAKRAKIPMEKIPINISKYGNMNGSTIPFLICDMAGENLLIKKKVVFSGFGVGLSWGAAALEIDELDYANIINC